MGSGWPAWKPTRNGQMFMKWKKLGKIFDPTDHALPNGCVEFAQSPQALVCTDFIRVYFATRQRDAIGKYVSHIAFVDFDRRLSRILGVSKHAAIEVGGLGAFDEHGIFPINIVRHGGTIYAFTCGWSRRGPKTQGAGMIGRPLSSV